MKTNTSIVQIQNSASSVVPRPNKTHLIAVMVQETIAVREAENLVREKKQAALQARLNKEIEKFKKKTVRIGDLSVRWDTAGAFVYLHGQNIEGTPAMKTIREEMKKVNPLTTHPDLVKQDVEARMKSEIINAILEQPGMKTALRSTIAKLGL